LIIRVYLNRPITNNGISPIYRYTIPYIYVYIVIDKVVSLPIYREMRPLISNYLIISTRPDTPSGLIINYLYIYSIYTLYSIKQ